MLAIILTLLLKLSLTQGVSAQQSPLKAARDEYQMQVDAYRKVYDKYIVDKAQYAQLPSNTNQELLIMSAKQTLSTQAQVWYSYFKALTVDAQETTNKPELWQEIETNLTSQQATIAAKIEEYSLLTDKPAVLTALVETNAKTKEHKMLGARAQALIKFFRFRYALDEISKFNSQLAIEVPKQIVNPAERESQLRAIAEVERLTTDMEAKYAEAMNNYATSPPTSGEYMLDQAMEDLRPGYLSLVRAQKIMREAAKGIEL